VGGICHHQALHVDLCQPGCLQIADLTVYAELLDESLAARNTFLFPLSVSK
jgi:hypothetical protein